LKTTNIKGKEYVQVNERIRAFRSEKMFEGFRLNTKIIHSDEKECLMEAQIFDPQGNLVANGHAHEVRNAGMVNKTSHIENCETSAWGRALGNLGIGVTDSIATAEEVSLAIENQKPADREALIVKLLEQIQLKNGSVTNDDENRVEKMSDSDIQIAIKKLEAFNSGISKKN
jgi:hypothetical protein